ncbi:MAG: hypothetical protein GWP06_17840 [Actinobacteria bacterium]|nr:hypothetical protein [Actinomycetota bacterium]
MEYIVIIGLLLASAVYIISPLLKPGQADGAFAPKTDEMLAELHFKKEGAYATIRELEFDLNMGKLSAEDYETLKAQYMFEAVGYIKTIDELQMNRNRQTSLPEKDLEKEIEQEIPALRSTGSAKTANVFCSQCGQRASSSNHFCAKCGTKLIKP